MGFFKAVKNIGKAAVDPFGLVTKQAEIAMGTAKGVAGGKSLGAAFKDAAFGSGPSATRSELSDKQNRLLQQALKEMGLSKSERIEASQSGEGSPRAIIESALKQANKSQDGGGRNG